ncbi:hypothetical protein BG004_007059, partial [Podila humilis]
MQLSASVASSNGYQRTIQFLFWGAAIITVTLAALRHVFDPANKTRCESLLNHGSWLDHQRTQWQPKGCMLKTYDTASTSTCIRGFRIVMIGDSVVRQLYYSIVKKIIPDANTNGDRHSDIFFKDDASGVSFEFYWDPFLNSTRAIAMTTPLLAHTPIDDMSDDMNGENTNNNLDTTAGMQEPEKTPSILLVGSGLWYLR